KRRRPGRTCPNSTRRRNDRGKGRPAITGRTCTDGKCSGGAGQEGPPRLFRVKGRKGPTDYTDNTDKERSTGNNPHSPQALSSFFYLFYPCAPWPPFFLAFF